MMDKFSIYLDNYDGTSATASQKTAQINWAIRELGRRMHLYDPRIVFTLTSPIASTNGAMFNLRDTAGTVSRKVWKVLGVVIDNNTLRSYAGTQGLWALDQLNRVNPAWRTEPTGTPTRAVQLSRTRLLLSPPPSGAFSNNFIAGYYIPASLVNSTDDGVEPDIPEELHECLAYFAAQKVAMPTATEQEQWTRLGAYKAEWEEMVNEIALQNRNIAEGAWQDFAWAYPRHIRT